jgi:hypothetical protein
LGSGNRLKIGADVPIRKFPEIGVEDQAGDGEARGVDLKPTNLDDVLTAAAGPREANSPLRPSILQ